MTEAQATDNSSDQNIEAGVSSGSNSAGVKTPVATPPSYSGTKHKIDFDGYEVELDYDDLVNTFKKTTREAYEYKQRLTPLQELTQAIKSGNLDVLEQLVPDDVLRDFSEKKLLKYIEAQNMDPKEKALRDREAKIAAWEAEQERAKKAQEQSAYEQQKVQASQQVQHDLIEAAKDIAGDAKLTPRFLRRIAEQMYAKMSSGLPVNGKDVAKAEWQGLQDDYLEYQNTMLRKDPSAFIASLPPELIKAIRQHDLNSSRPFQSPQVSKSEDDDIPVKKGLSIDDTFKALDRFYDKKRKKLSNN